MSFATKLTNFFNEIGDDRVKNWLLMSSPFPTITICAIYFILIKFVLPFVMRHRRPAKIGGFLVFYNIFQVIFNIYLLHEILVSEIMNDFSFMCQPVDRSPHGIPIRAATACWLFFLSKFVDFCDTFFFVLKKKEQHVSTLHVFHHGSMPIMSEF